MQQQLTNLENKIDYLMTQHEEAGGHLKEIIKNNLISHFSEYRFFVHSTPDIHAPKYWKLFEYVANQDEHLKRCYDKERKDNDDDVFNCCSEARLL